VATYTLLPTTRPLALALLLLVVFADLLGAGKAIIAWQMAADGAYKLQQFDPTGYYEPTAAGRFLQSKGGTEPFRYFGYAQHVYGGVRPYTLRWADPEMRALEVNNRAILSGLHDIQGYNPIHLARYDAYMAALNGGPQNYHYSYVFQQGLNSRLLDLLNARYIVVPAVTPPDQVPPPLGHKYEAVYADDHVKVLENLEALPRAWIVHSAQEAGPGQALELLASGAVDPRLTTLLEQPPPSLVRPGNASTDGVSITAYDADWIRVRTTTDAPGLLVLSEVYYPA